MERDRDLVRSARGASAPEYVVLLAAVAIVAAGAWQSLGEGAQRSVACAAADIGSGSAGSCEAGRDRGDAAPESAATGSSHTAALTRSSDDDSWPASIALARDERDDGIADVEPVARAGGDRATTRYPSAFALDNGGAGGADGADGVDATSAAVVAPDDPALGWSDAAGVSLDEVVRGTRRTLDVARDWLLHAGTRLLWILPGTELFWHATGQADDVAAFRRGVAEGLLDAAGGTLESLWQVGGWLLSQPGQLLADPVAYVTAPIGFAGDAVTHIDDTLAAIGDFAGAIVGGVIDGAHTFAYGDSEDAGKIFGWTTFQVALVAAPGPAIQGARSLVTAARGAGTDLLRARRVGAMLERLPGDEVRLVRPLHETPRSLAELAAMLDPAGADALLSRWSRVEHAFGNERNAIQGSWELEGTVDGSPAIFDYYRDVNVPEAEWAARTAAEHAEAFRPGTFGGYVRRDDAPPWVAMLLENIGRHSFETKTATYTTTLAEQLEQATWVANHVGGAFHFHTTFRVSAEHADEVAALAQAANEELVLLRIAERWTRLHHETLAPLNDKAYAQMLELFRTGEEEVKYYAVGGRGWRKYGSVRRVGLELRWENEDLVEAARMLDTFHRVLADPAGAVVRLGPRSSGYHARELLAYDRLSAVTQSRFPREVQDMLYEVGDNQWRTRVSLPMVRWEDRVYLPAEVRAAVVAKRARLVSALEDLARARARRVATGRAPDLDYRAIVEKLVSEWSHDTELWAYL